MDKHVVFLSGIYGKKIQTFLNEFFDLLCVEYPDCQSFQVPMDTKEYFFSWSFEDNKSMTNFLLPISRDPYVRHIFVFDRQSESLALHKGIGDVDQLLKKHEDLMQSEYEGAFGDVFQYAQYQDVRRIPLKPTFN